MTAPDQIAQTAKNPLAGKGPSIHDEEAATWYRKSIELNRSFFLAHCFLSCALVNLGQQAEAEAAAKAALAINPGVSIGLLRRVIRTAADDVSVLAGAERLFESLRKAGIPEGR